ncbi:MAG TPA: DUF6531 domain-containing protein [Gaiellaceae bacterium]
MAAARTWLEKRSLTVHIPATTYTGNTTWTLANSPYVLDGDVTVAAGATLTIEPGVVVKLNGQFRTLRINGTLSAVGTQATPITFTSYQDDSAGGDTNGDGNATSGAPGQWYNISLYSSTSQVKYATVRYGGYGSAQNYAPISLYGSGYAVTLDHDTISDNQYSAVSIGGGSSATITNSILTRNKYGVYVDYASATIDHSTISNNTSRGIWFNLPTFNPLPPATSITSSDITGNTSYGVYIGANGDYPLASMPKASGNNIYANNSNGIQLAVVGYPGFKRAELNWRGNYWGDGVYFWYDASLCTSTSPNSPGHLAYRSSGGNVPAGPIDGGIYIVSPDPYTVYWCGYDAFKIDAGDFSPTRLDTGPRVALNQTFGVCGQIVNAYTGGDCRSDPIQSATGNFTDSSTDLSLPGTGVPFAFVRSYNSLDLTKGELGQGWTDSVAAALTIKSNGDVTLRAEDGQQVEYTKQGDGSFVGAAGALSTLASVSGGYEVTRLDGQKYRFDIQGRLTSIVDRSGQGLTVAYGADGKVSTVTDAAGRQAAFTHNANGLLTAISMPNGRTVGYAYTNGLLTSYTDPGGRVWTYTYETHGFLEKKVDPLGHTVYRNVYGADGRVSDQYDALNNRATFAWDQATQTTTETDARGNTWKDVYANNVLTKRIDPLGHQTQFGTDSAINRTSVTGATGSQTTMAYDSRGNVTSITAPASLNAQKTFTYDSNNNVTTVTDARNKVTSYAYDGLGRNTSVTHNGQTIATYTYDSAGRMLTSTDALGNTTTHTYDANGNEASVTDPLGKTTTFTYDAAGNALSTTDPLGRTTSNTYDAPGNVLTTTDPLGNVTTYTYDAAGNRLTTKDSNNHTTTFAYDAANRVVSTTAPDGGVTSYTYDSVGNELTQTDPRGHVTTYTYDADNRVASVTAPLGEKTTYGYDADGNLASSVDPRGNVSGANPGDYTTTNTSDAAGRTLTTTDPLGHVTTRTYDAVGNLTSTADAKNHTTSYTYDATGRLLTATAPDGGTTTFTYDAAGNVRTRTDANGHTTTYAYDADGRCTSVTSPTGKVWTWTYNGDGEVVSKTDPNNVTTTYAHDAGGRVISITYSDSTPSLSYTYDAVGNRLSLTDGSGTETFSYDVMNRLVGVSRGADTFTYAYDLGGNVASRTYPDGKVSTYSYDNDNRMASVTTGGGTTSYAYDAAGDLTQTTLPSTNGYVETRTYDRAGQLVEVANASTGGGLSDFAATLDAVGNPTQIVRSGAISSTTSLTYDADDRVTAVSGTNAPNLSWTYDGVGNRLSETRNGSNTTYTYNAADQLTLAGASTYTYDASGNETAGGGRSFTYNGAGEVTSTSSGGTTTTYVYDGDGNRLSSASGGATTRFLWDSVADLPQLAIERDGGGNELRAYSYGVRRVSMIVASGTFYYHYDTFGSVANVTAANGTREWTESYEPFGQTFTETQNDPNAPSNPMKFSGEYEDATGVYNLRAREYDTSVGRFTSLDPARDVANTSPSPYVYAADRPTVLDDPGGLHESYIAESTHHAGYASGPNTLPADLYAAQQGTAAYVDPFRRSTWIRTSRTDQGVDFYGAGPIVAIGRARIIGYHAHSGWLGAYLLYEFLDGQFSGKYVYVAEGIAATQTSGIAARGKTIARFTAAGGSSPGIETGWGTSHMELSYARSQTPDGFPKCRSTGKENRNNLQAGKAFARFLRSLGRPTRDNPGPGPMFPAPGPEKASPWVCP